MNSSNAGVRLLVCTGATVGVLESGKLPPAEVIQYLAEKCGVTADRVALLVAPTASIAGNMQVVARSIETAMHKLHALGYDVANVESGTSLSTEPVM